MSDAPRPMPRWRAVQWFAAAIAVLVVVVVVGLVSGLLALGRLGEARRSTVDRLDPAIVASLRLSNALLSEQTGVRGYALTGDRGLLEAYARGRSAEPVARRELLRLTRDLGSGIARRVAAVQRAVDAWRAGYVRPALGRGGPGGGTRAGEALFADVRAQLRGLEAALRTERRAARSRLSDTATLVRALFVAFGAVLLLSVLAAALLLRRVLVAPIGRLAGQVREVVRGDFDRHVEADGAREVAMLGADVEAMRIRILQERDELRRSNAELEQFAYVASHDLQEPLRKVASFTQMLQRRYGGQLDERADTYIDFAVDGAKRMQDLINDLLAFSRVGRITEPEAVVDCGELVDRARGALSGAIESSGAEMAVGPMPRVRGEPSLLGLVFQNLIANGLKFRGREAPRISVEAQRVGDEWCFTVADNGIGIEAEYADRIFIIFQRLHPRTSYEGTGIGLAMCRKVIEYHGGRIWLDTDRPAGAAFHFTLPVIQDDQEDSTPP